MAETVGYLDVATRGSRSSFVSGGLTVYQPVDASAIAGDGILFDVKGDDLGWYYNSSTDLVYLINSTGDSVSLTRVGDYWQWLVGPNDLRTPETAPGATSTMTCQIVAERNVAGVRTRLSSKPFTLNVVRQYGFAPGSIAGLVGHFDAYDLSAIADGAAVPSWDDRTLEDNDLTEATNRPAKRLTGAGRPFVWFDGTNDVLTSELSHLGTACTLFVAGFIDSYDATVRGFVQVGGTNGARLAFNSSNLQGRSGSDVANTSLPALDTWFVGVVTKTASGAITVQRGLNAPASQASTAAVTPGAITVGDTDADSPANVGIGEILIYDSVLSASNIERVVRALQNKWQATG